MADQFPPGDFQSALPDPQYTSINHERLKQLAAKRAAAEAAVEQSQAAQMANMRKQDKFMGAIKSGGSPAKMRALLSAYERMERQLPEERENQMLEEALLRAVKEAQFRESKVPLGSLKATYK